MRPAWHLIFTCERLCNLGKELWARYCSSNEFYSLALFLHKESSLLGATCFAVPAIFQRYILWKTSRLWQSLYCCFSFPFQYNWNTKRWQNRFSGGDWEIWMFMQGSSIINSSYMSDELLLYPNTSELRRTATVCLGHGIYKWGLYATESLILFAALHYSHCQIYMYSWAIRKRIICLSDTPKSRTNITNQMQKRLWERCFCFRDIWFSKWFTINPKVSQYRLKLNYN